MQRWNHLQWGAEVKVQVPALEHMRLTCMHAIRWHQHPYAPHIAHICLSMHVHASELQFHSTPCMYLPVHACKLSSQPIMLACNAWLLV